MKFFICLICLFTFNSYAQDGQVFILAQCHTLTDNNSEELILNKVSPRKLVCQRNLSRMQCELSDEDSKNSEIFRVTEESKDHLLLKNSSKNHHIYVNTLTGKVTSVQTLINTSKTSYLVGTEICRGVSTNSKMLIDVKKTSQN